ncbi:hypothetical protein DOY81_003749 [Sarcophaga bullata]|nr:hypothetical protein DOY81_003749 [Sarcophaga bullata]
MTRVSLIVLTFLAVGLMDLAVAILYVSPQEWAEYKTKYNKDYNGFPFSETYAQYYYIYNKKMIEKHNLLYDRGLRTYRLEVNQFTDMRFIHFNALFPEARAWTRFPDTQLPTLSTTIADSFDIRTFLTTNRIEDQGTKCNSGWAYAAVKSIEIQKAFQDPLPGPLSTQNIIDCAGRSNACHNQVPQAAFEYLTTHKQNLHLEADYRNNNELSEPDMCRPTGQFFTNLALYAKIDGSNDELIKQCVNAFYPVVVEFNPTSFEFMHYSEGIFQQPYTRRGSHFMVVVGYGHDVSLGLDYWLLQNSFGDTWGEQGVMKLLRSPGTKLSKIALVPLE